MMKIGDCVCIMIPNFIESALITFIVSMRGIKQADDIHN